MITRSQYNQSRTRTIEFLDKAGLQLTNHDLENLEVADFGLGDLEHFGAQIVTLLDTGQMVVKLIVLFPFQILPEHTHPQIGDYPGKEETIRCHWGVTYLCRPGEPDGADQARIPREKKASFTAFSEIVLNPGEQVTLAPGTAHWFQGGPAGAVVWSFTTKAFDLQDHFTDPGVRRATVIKED
jgi:D-lyxose ketol-isomerase